MSNGSDKLVYIYSVDTSSFYNDKEYELDQKLIILRQYKSNLNEIISPLIKFKNESNKILKSKECTTEKGAAKLNKLEDDLTKFYSRYSILQDKIDEYLFYDEETNLYKVNANSTLYLSEHHLNYGIRELKKLLDLEAINHTGIRKLRNVSLKKSNIISLFESALTRNLGIQEDEQSTDIIVIRAYRYAIFENLVKNGFLLNGDKYEYFASSAGQIRNKKSCFIRTSALNANNHEVRNKLMCGLSKNKINRKGGINQNKFQAYLSLANSASTPWMNFDINRCIVVDDMELTVSGIVDFIDYETYKIKRCEKSVSINFTDGAGIMLPSVSEKSFQFRMPFFKGLLVPFDFLDFISHYPNAKFVVKDINGIERDIVSENIQIIFTKSQFKLHSYYESWDEYKHFFLKYKCEASICRTDEDEFEEKPINYQMIQSLSFSDDELEILSKRTSDDILRIGEDKNTMLRLLGADSMNTKKNYFQQALSIYPELLNDQHSKQSIKDRKKSLVKEAKSGKILLEGTKRSYISPDLYAFAEWLFGGVKQPTGLLKNGEVSCRLYGNKKLDILRSPHLFREHCVRQNVVNETTEKWYISNCVYTSVSDMISKQLMFDVDGDDALIVSDDLFVSRAERQMKKTVPLEYTLATSKKSRITNENQVNSLKAAYSKNIGEISNLITKIWNSGKILRKGDIDLIKILCMENNAVIDFAKTLWMPTRPEAIEEQIKKYSKMKVPHFFLFAKDKDKNNVEKINKSTLNRLTELIPDRRIHFTSVAGKLEYKNLMKNKRQKIDDDLGREIIEKYIELDRSKSKEVRKQAEESDKVNSKVELKVYKDIRKSLLMICNNPVYISDVLVKYLFEQKKSEYKDTLWNSFGKEIVRNLEYNILGIKRCLLCPTEIEKSNSKRYCDPCAKEKERRRKRDLWNKING
ncbi:RNA dependent RNA polymerase [Brevibacillus sp. NRS-1366]|uniref:RNA dependent RNA polymerase n=1 Tax=Brevibacillus sp. NRS-1366 TaxID=3233899 RepID=UPI003D20D82E